jgi:tripartite-type tricarboxylate transporter receptor subunit TctC
VYVVPGMVARVVLLVLPKAIVARLNAEVNKTLVSPAAKQNLGGVGYELVGGSQEQFTELVNRELAKWADVVKRTGAKID